MGKPTGFMDYERQDKPAESPLERIKHFNEFHTLLAKKNRSFRARAVWRAEFRSVSLESRLQEWPVDVHCTTLCRSGMT